MRNTPSQPTGKPGRIHTSIVSAHDGKTVRLTIEDSGPGIPADVLPRIFDPFFTTKDVGQGTGLGLAITYGIIQEHGGTVQASNVPNGGARFTIDLPEKVKEKVKSKSDRKLTATELFKPAALSPYFYF